MKLLGRLIHLQPFYKWFLKTWYWQFLKMERGKNKVHVWYSLWYNIKKLYPVPCEVLQLIPYPLETGEPLYLVRCCSISHIQWKLVRPCTLWGVAAYLIFNGNWWNLVPCEVLQHIPYTMVRPCTLWAVIACHTCTGHWMVTTTNTNSSG